MEVAWTGEESESEPSKEKSIVVGGKASVRNQPKPCEQGMGYKQQWKIGYIQAIEPIKYIKDNGDQIGIVREKNYKH